MKSRAMSRASTSHPAPAKGRGHHHGVTQTASATPQNGQATEITSTKHELPDQGETAIVTSTEYSSSHPQKGETATSTLPDLYASRRGRTNHRSATKATSSGPQESATSMRPSPAEITSRRRKATPGVIPKKDLPFAKNGKPSNSATPTASPASQDGAPGKARRRVSAAVCPPELALLISTIRETHRMRVDFHRAEKRLTLQIKAICRRFCEGSKDEAGVLYKAITGKGEHAKVTVATAYCLPLLAARDAVTAPRKAAEKRLAKLAEQLPCWPWVESVNGFGAMGLGQIVGECGDLAIYANPAKLWKRMGVGMVCVNGEWKRQQRVGGAEALEHGYSPERRSILFCIGESLIKKQNPYRDLYLARKEYEAERDPEAKPIRNHRRAQRYMEKRLLRDLWRVWRGQRKPEVHTLPVSPRDADRGKPVTHAKGVGVPERIDS